MVSWPSSIVTSIWSRENPATASAAAAKPVALRFLWRPLLTDPADEMVLETAVNGAALAGASRIIAIDTNASKLEKAREMGATDTINASNVDVVAAVKDMTEGQGVPYSFEAIGLKATAEQCFQMLRPGGVATIIGMIPFGPKIELHGADFLRDRIIQGTSLGGNRFRVDMPRLLELWRQGRLKLDTLISGHIKLDQINEGFAMLKSGAPVRNLIDFGVS